MRPGADRESSLVARARDGDDAAWRDLVSTYAPYVYSIATRAFRLSHHDAEDVVQEAFARTHVHLGDLRDDAALKPWLAQVTRRLAIDRLRSSARESPTQHVDVQPDAAAEDEFARLEDAMEVSAALGTLPQHCAEILERYFAQDQDYRTIGRQLDLPSGTVASRISRCRAKLREYLGPRSEKRRG